MIRLRFSDFRHDKTEVVEVESVTPDGMLPTTLALRGPDGRVVARRMSGGSWVLPSEDDPEAKWPHRRREPHRSYSELTIDAAASYERQQLLAEQARISARLTALGDGDEPVLDPVAERLAQADRRDARLSARYAHDTTASSDWRS